MPPNLVISSPDPSLASRIEPRYRLVAGEDDTHVRGAVGIRLAVVVPMVVGLPNLHSSSGEGKKHHGLA